MGLLPIASTEAVASTATATAGYWTIQTRDHSATGKHLCITSGSVGGYTELVDCNGSTYLQQWTQASSIYGSVWVSGANPGKAMSWSSSSGAHLSLATPSTSNHNEIMEGGDPFVETYNHFRPHFAISRCAQPADSQYRKNYAILYLEPCDSSSAGSPSLHLRVSLVVFSGLRAMSCHAKPAAAAVSNVRG